MKLSEFDTGKTCGDVEFERMTPKDFDEVGMEIGATFGHSSIPSIAFDGVRAENARLREQILRWAAWIERVYGGLTNVRPPGPPTSIVMEMRRSAGEEPARHE